MVCWGKMHNKRITFSQLSLFAIFMVVAYRMCSCQSLMKPYPEKEHIHLNESLEEHLQEEIEEVDFGGWGEPDGPEIWRWNVEDFPIPQKQPRFCRRMAASNVCDSDDILQTQQADLLDQLISKIYNETPCICGDKCGSNSGGLKIGIALFKNYYRPYNEHPSKIIRDFTQNLRAKWNMGVCEDDLLIAIATDEKQLYTAVGEATEHFISYEDINRIFAENRVYFSNKNFYEGLRTTLESYYKIMLEVKPPMQNVDNNVGIISGIVVAVVLLVGIIILICAFVYKKLNNKNDESDEDADVNTNESHSNSWKRRDIKYIFQSFKSRKDKYDPCKTDEEDHKGPIPASAMVTSDEILNTELAKQEPVDFEVSFRPLDNGTTSSETNKKDIESSSPEWPRKVSIPDNDVTEMKFDTFLKKSPPAQPFETDL